MIVAPSAALAHPFGAPPVATVTASDNVVRIAWVAAEDDLLALGRHVRAFDDLAPGTTGAKALASSESLREYFRTGVTIRQDGRRCVGTSADLSNLPEAGAQLVYMCPATVATVDLSVTLLTDVNPAYRTAVVAPSPVGRQTSMLTRETPTATLRFGPAKTAAPHALTVFAGIGHAGWLDNPRTTGLVLAAALLVGALHALAPGHRWSILPLAV